ncbi:MAG TPA: cytochrome C [Blastocatellia bacterium]|nr:cytochrome C [Blastocatellia bacterium]
MDWHQLWEITTLPDNIPIVAMLFLIPYFGWLGFKQAIANDRLIEQLEADPKLAKTHHRKTWPWQPHWARELHVWPFLLRIEFLAVIIVTAILFVWSITLNAPLEEPANPNLTMNPSKAPWYFLGLQEMLVYFDPWIAGVVMPSIMIVGLMAFPYVDSNPLGVGYYTWRQRRVAIGAFLVGFVTWLALIVIGTFMRGPGWIWFWPGQTWDHNTVIYEVNRDLPDILGIYSQPWKGIFGAVVVAIFFVVTGAITHKIITSTTFERKIFERTSLLQYLTFQVLAITILWALPVKLVLRLLFRIKYVWVTPWFNV